MSPEPPRRIDPAEITCLIADVHDMPWHELTDRHRHSALGEAAAACTHPDDDRVARFNNFI